MLLIFNQPLCALLLLLLLLQMFGPEAPPLPWDTDNEYSRDRVELYYLSNAGQQLQQVRGKFQISRNAVTGRCHTR
jgi:hypothetical protein